MKKLMTLLCLIIMMMNFNVSFALDLCQAIALEDVSAIESPKSIIKKGEFLTAITQYNLPDELSKEPYFCAHGDYCYPTHIIKNGIRVEALRLTNCKIVGNSVELIRSKVDPATLRAHDIDEKLISLGMSIACAANATEFYLKKPKSKCGKLVQHALEGNPTAIELIEKDPDYCCNYWKIK